MRAAVAVPSITSHRARWTMTAPAVTLAASAATATVNSSSTADESPCHLHEWQAINASELVAQPVVDEDHTACGMIIWGQAVAPWSSMLTGWALLNLGGVAQPIFNPLEVLRAETFATSWDSYAFDFADVDRDGMIDAAVFAGESSGQAQVYEFASLSDLLGQTNAQLVGSATGISAIDAVMLGGRGVTLVAMADATGTYLRDYSSGSLTLDLNTGAANGEYALYPVYEDANLHFGYFWNIYGFGLNSFTDHRGNPYGFAMTGASYAFEKGDEIGVTDLDGDDVGDVWFYDRDANEFWVYTADLGTVEAALNLDYSSDLTALFDAIDVVALANGQPDEIMIHDVDADGDNDLLIGAGQQIIVYELFGA